MSEPDTYHDALLREQITAWQTRALKAEDDAAALGKRWQAASDGLIEWQKRALKAEAAGKTILEAYEKDNECHQDLYVKWVEDLAASEAARLKAEAEAEKWKGLCKALVYPSNDAAKVLADTRAILSEAMP